MADARALDEVGERVALEVAAHLVGDRRPRPPGARSGPRSGRARPGSVVSGPSTAARISRERDLLRRAGEHVAAADAALRSHEPGALHREQDLLEVRLGKVRALGDLLDRRRPVGPVQREREQRAGGVVAAGRHLHRPCSLAVAGRAAPCSHTGSGAGGRLRSPAVPTAGARAGRVRRRVASSRSCPALTGRPDRAVAARAGPRRDDGGAARARRPRLGAAAGAPRRRCPSSARSPAARSRRSLPSTTAAALTSITTGLAPIQHGVLGFRIRVDGAVLNVLRWTGRRRPACAGPVHACSGTPPFLGRPVPVVTKQRVPTSGFTDRAPAGRAVPRLEHDRGARRALPPARRPAASRSCTPTTRASTPSRTSSASHDAYCRARARVRRRARRAAARRAAAGGRARSSPPTTARCTSATTGTTSRRSATSCGRCSGEGRFRWLTGARGGTDELAAAARAEFGHLAAATTRGAVIGGGHAAAGFGVGRVRAQRGGRSRDRAHGDTRGDRACRALPRERRVLVHHGHGAARRWRRRG